VSKRSVAHGLSRLHFLTRSVKRAAPIDNGADGPQTPLRDQDRPQRSGRDMERPQRGAHPTTGRTRRQRRDWQRVAEARARVERAKNTVRGAFEMAHPEGSAWF